MTLYLHGLGHAHPANEIDNRFLESLDIGTDDGWILERVGIRSRRTVLPLDYIRETRNQDTRAALEASEWTQGALAGKAARMAAARAGIEPDRIGLVLAGNSAGDTGSCPAVACHVAAALGLDVPAFDVASACTSFYLQLHWLSLMQPERLPDFVLLAAPETLTTTVDYRDRTSAVLWGDGAAAAIVSTRHPSRVRVLDSAVDSRPSALDKVRIPRGGHFAQEGRVVQLFGIKRMTEALTRLRSSHEQDGRSLHFVGHQANLRMLERVREQAGIPPAQHHTNVEWFGNTGAASAASVISMAWEKWRPVDDLAVAGVGAGLTWSSYLLRWEEAA